MAAIISPDCIRATTSSSAPISGGKRAPTMVVQCARPI